MAKGSPFTTFTGKLGQIVGFIIKSASSKQVQGMRAYQPNVSNPKTVLQANQRLSLKPLNNFARALAPVIERGFEGIKYGAESRREFMRLNMTSFNGPYLRKGNDDPVPGPFQVSRGSLVPVDIRGIMNAGSGEGQTQGLYSDLYVGASGLGTGTWGTFCDVLKAQNTDIQDGDQLTFVFVVSSNGSFVYRVRSVTVDSSSADAFTPDASNLWHYGDVQFSRTTIEGERLLGFSINFDDENETIVGGCVIQSREGSKGEHLRSDASMWCSPGIYDVWMSQEQYEAALSSYMGDQSVIDWPVQLTAESAIVLQDSVSVHVPVTALSSSTADHYPNGIDVLGYVMSDGTVGVWVETSAMYLLDMAGRRITWLVSDEPAYAQLVSSDAFPWKYYFGGTVSA